MAHNHAGVDATTAASGAEHQKRLMMSLGLTSTVFIAEVVSAIVTGSLALLVDAGHMLTDMSVLIASTVTAVLMQRKPSNKRTWGWVHDVRLLLFMGILGLAANVGSIFILAGQSEDNMNMKAAFLEVMNDALGSVAVIVSAIVLISTGWAGFDAVAGGIIALMMIPRAFVLLRNAVRVLLEETPQELDLDEVREHLEQVPHVVAVHDLHASTVSTGMPVVMAHVVVERGLTMDDAADILSQLQNCLREHFPVSVPHTTFQLEPEGYDSDSRKELHS